MRVTRSKGMLATAIVVVGLVAAACVPLPSTQPHRFPPERLRIYPQHAPDGYRSDPVGPCNYDNDRAIKAIGDYLRVWFWPTQVQYAAGPDPCRHSLHREFRAADLFFDRNDPAQKARADALVMHLMATDQAGNPYAIARRMGIQELQWNDNIWTSARANEGWRPSGETAHRDHVHVGINMAANVGFITFLGNWTVLGGAPGCQGGVCLAWVPISSYAT